MSIHVRIERLTVEGVDWQPAQRAQFERAFVGELARLLARGDAPARSGAIASARAPDAAVPARATPHHVGVRVARSVFEGMRGAGGDDSTHAGGESR